MWENQLKWEAAHIRGLALCRLIENAKRPVLKENTETDTQYPDEMQSPCAKLKIITTIFDDILTHGIESLRQLKSIGSSCGDTECSAKLFKTWTMDRLCGSVAVIVDAYQQEYKLKLMVLENIAHAGYEAELTQNVSVWQHLRPVNEDVRLQFKMLCYECDLKSLQIDKSKNC